eukprot:CAMPEP_0172726966 /NCGR_PEP_ID=MMETSP1074-20121228/91407_1 /TAXON_ID=2916 /ORGANISM="Ceratium fusus, Strain PA161109" /LENGTH=1140 /DNA_ID=CAMNT_0013554071 /DNA_START=72 /DNA_END=3494 /DNA_ORIENTATION=+
MACTAECADELLAQLERSARRHSAHRTSEVRLRAAERDLLRVAERVRDLLCLALQGDRILLSDVFGGNCTRIHGFREVIDMVEFAEGEPDQRWKQMGDAIETIETILRQMGMFKPSQLEKKASMEFRGYRGFRGRFLPGERVWMKPDCDGCRAETFSVEPCLPEGLSLQAATGEIAGMLKPGVEIPERDYTVTAFSATGETMSFELRFSVAPPAPKALNYPGVQSVCFTCEVLVWAAEVQGGPAKEWSINPALPCGLSLDPRTGSIVGMPASATEMKAYAITVANVTGSVSTVVHFRVEQTSPVSLNYPGLQREYTLGGFIYLTPEVRLRVSETERKSVSSKWRAVQRKFLTRGATWQSVQARMSNVRFSVVPPLPDGLALTPKTGRIIGKPTASVRETTFTITCCNDGGSVSCDVPFAVNMQPPRLLDYPGLGPVYFTRQPMKLLPLVEGHASEWSVSPELPTGINLDMFIGIISGVPAEPSVQGSWAVSARNAAGESSFVLSFSVQQAAPTNLAYPCLCQDYGLGRPILLQPSLDGEVDAYSVEPELPRGVSLDPATGVLSGTPCVVTASDTYWVTAKNTTGVASVSLTFCVKVMPPALLSYPRIDDVYSVGETVSLEAQVDGGAASWTVEPSLPKGVDLDVGTGTIQGTFVSAAVESFYVVTAANEAGGTSTVLTLEVIEPEPEGLIFPSPCGGEYSLGDEVFLEPTLSSGCGVTFSVEPMLPESLQLHPQTGIISGTFEETLDFTAYIISATNTRGTASTTLTLACTETIDALTGVNQHFALLVECINDIADMVEEPVKSKSLGDWMVWIVHRAWLNDPALTDINFAGKAMPPPHNEPRIAPKLMSALAHNTHIVSLQLSNSNLIQLQGHELADALRKNTTLQSLNLESNSLDSASIMHVAQGLRDNPNSALEQLRLSNQTGLREFYGRPVEQAFAELMEHNTTLTKLGLPCNDANWRMSIDRALLRNTDLARRRRKGCSGTDDAFEEIMAQLKPLSRLVMSNVPDVPAWEVFDDDDHRTALIRSYVASSKRLPTREQLQSFARARGQPIPYSAVATVVKDFRSKLLGAAVNSHVACFDTYGAAFPGELRNWCEKNERWSIDVWQAQEMRRFNFISEKLPILEVSAEVAAWQQPSE